MSGGEWAALLAALFFGLIAVATTVLLGNLFRVVTSLKELVDGIRSETVPLIGEVANTVRGVNKELERLDGIAAGVGGIVHNVESISRTVHATVTNPLVKGLAFFMGAKRAARKMKDKE